MDTRSTLPTKVKEEEGQLYGPDEWFDEALVKVDPDYFSGMTTIADLERRETEEFANENEISIDDNERELEKIAVSLSSQVHQHV